MQPDYSKYKMNIFEFMNFLQKHKLAEDSSEMARMSVLYEQKIGANFKVIHCKNPPSWDEYGISDYNNFLLSLYDISMSSKFRFRYCQADQKAGFKNSEINFKDLVYISI